MVTVTELLARFGADTSSLDAGYAHATDQNRRYVDSGNSALGTLQSIGKTALAVTGGGLLAIGGGMAAAAVTGFSMNKSMENVTAQLNAFTKDGAKSAEILEMIRERAAKTPFEFNEMAKATAGLLPASKASGEGLESLIEKAEILAASNPAQGLEGAAFALREAVSGDFTSIIERFNLPRQFINKLKEEGVPNLEIVGRAMQEMGFDTDLVSNLAETADGRWSTFMDTLTGVAATVTKPLFDSFSAGLGSVNSWLSANEPLLTQMANVIGIAISNAIEILADHFPPLDGVLTSVVGGFANFIQILSAASIAILDAILEGEELTTSNFGLSGSAVDVADKIVTMALAIYDGIAAVVAFVKPIFDAVAQFVTFQDVLTALGIAIAAVVIPALISVVVTMAPIIATAAAVLAAVTLLRTAWENDWGGIQEKTAAVWEFCQGIFDTIQAWLEQTFPDGLAGLADSWRDNWQLMQRTLETIWNAISSVWRTVSTWLTVTLPNAVSDLHTKWSSGWENIQTATNTKWEAIKGHFNSMKTWLDATLPTSITGLGTNTESGFESIKNSIVSKFDTVIATFRDVQNWLTDKLQSALNSFKDALGGLTFSNPFQAIVTAISAIPTAITNAKTTLANFVSWLGTLRIPDLFSMLKLPDWLTGYVGGGDGRSRAGTIEKGSALTLAAPAGAGFDVDALAAAIVRALASGPPVVRAEFVVNVAGDPAATAVSYQMARKVGEILNRRAS
jgi:hypothetical protein